MLPAGARLTPTWLPHGTQQTPCYNPAVELTREQVQHIATLARLGLSEDDLARFPGQLGVILDYFERLSQVDTEGVPPTAHTLPLHNVMREDEPAPPLDAGEILANAPLKEDGRFRVRAILDE